MDVVLAWQLRERSSAPRGVSSDGEPASTALIDPFDVLYERDLPGYRLPNDLEEIYGMLGFADEVLYANFVTSLDGVVNLGSIPSAGSVISGRNQHDRFLMGLLRACADAVLLGAGTLRATPGHQWTAEHIFPAMAESFRELRSALGRKPRPRLVLFSGSGNVDVAHPAVVAGATIVTTGAGAGNLRGRLPDSCDVIEFGNAGEVDVAKALDAIRRLGYEVLLTEGGPHLVGELIKADLLDEVFITLSPVVAGRGGDTRFGMVEGVELLPSRQEWSQLMSARRHDDFLFLRYDLRKSANP